MNSHRPEHCIITDDTPAFLLGLPGFTDRTLRRLDAMLWLLLVAHPLGSDSALSRLSMNNFFFISSPGQALTWTLDIGSQGLWASGWPRRRLLGNSPRLGQRVRI